MRYPAKTKRRDYDIIITITLSVIVVMIIIIVIILFPRLDEASFEHGFLRATVRAYTTYIILILRNVFYTKTTVSV